MKILLISDIHHFSTVDVYRGYETAFQDLKIEYESVFVPSLLNFLNQELAWGSVFAKLMNKDNEFTHVLFVSGVVVPKWLIKSIVGINIGIIATDDPHASKLTMEFKDYIKYYFSNEKTLADKYKNMCYLPTATNVYPEKLIKSKLKKIYRNDVVFIGTLYEDRVPVLEEVCRYCEEHNKTLKIIGPLLKTPKDSIIRKHADEVIINNKETLAYYTGAEVVINIDRNINWNPNVEGENPHLVDCGEPYSANPRVYEIGLCKTPQLFVNPRQEVKDLFGNSIYYCGYTDISRGLDEVFNDSEVSKEDKIINCYLEVYQNHTYLERCKKLLQYIKEIDKRN